MFDRKKITKAVISAAGFGTRMLPATKAVSKEMLPVAGKPLIQYAVEEATSSGIETVILVVRDHKSLIQAHFARDRDLESFLGERRLSASIQLIRNLAELADLRYVEQKNPLGLAHAISCARPLLGDEPFAVLLPAVIMVNGEPVISQLMRVREQHGGSVVAVREVEAQDVGRFGIVRTERSTMLPSSNSIPLIGLVEKPAPDKAPSRLGVSGRTYWNPSSGLLSAKPTLTQAEKCNSQMHSTCFAGMHLCLVFASKAYTTILATASVTSRLTSNSPSRVLNSASLYYNTCLPFSPKSAIEPVRHHPKISTPHS